MFPASKASAVEMTEASLDPVPSIQMGYSEILSNDTIDGHHLEAHATTTASGNGEQAVVSGNGDQAVVSGNGDQVVVSGNDHRVPSSLCAANILDQFRMTICHIERTFLTSRRRNQLESVRCTPLT